MPHWPSFPITQMKGRSWRIAVSISIAPIPKAPSPVTQITVSSGEATLAPSAKGRPGPREPRMLALLSWQPGRSARRWRAAATPMSPPSMVMVVRPSANSLISCSRRMGWMGVVLAR